MLPVLSSILLCLLTVILIYLLKRHKKTDVILLGICESGKTTIFYKLVHNSHAMTFTSLKENKGPYGSDVSIPYLLKQKMKLNIVDIPGHEKLRYEFFDRHKSSLKALIFVVDSNTISYDLKDTAEFLYNILTDPIISKSNPPILIACNKQDGTTAKGSKIVKKLMEKEL
ncbi:unnamed protein product [Protopolystoma xenopodis]|uniref:Signal recognition particle receptor subunit beta n=1 Tax=Protopolystoma xenopodis TaxID=117903 RepID=A0A448WII4_9PLAT|nr:unnamed protein product [Protopolystoma xenopodis]